MYEAITAAIITVSIGGVGGFFGWLLKGKIQSIDRQLSSIDEEIKNMEKELASFKLDVSQNYVSKNDHEKDLQSLKEYIKDGFSGIKDAIAGLHRRFDRFEERIQKELDGKEDKK